MSLSTLYVDLKTRGFEQIQSKLDTVRTSVAKLNTDGLMKGFSKGLEDVKANFEKIASVSRGLFATMSAGILGVSKVASDFQGKGLFDYLIASGKILANEIGKTFLPIILDMTKGILTLAQWFREMSASQRENLLWWTKLAGGVLIGIIAFSKLLSIATVGMGVLSSFGILGAASIGPWAAALAALAVGLGLVVEKYFEMQAAANKAKNEIDKGTYINKKDYEANEQRNKIMNEQDPGKRKEMASEYLRSKQDQFNEEESKNANQWNITRGVRTLTGGQNEDLEQHGKTGNELQIAKKIRAEAYGQDVDFEKKPQSNAAIGKPGVGQAFTPQIFDVASDYKKAATAEQGSPELELMRAFYGEQKYSNDKLDELVLNTRYHAQIGMSQ